MPIREEIVLDYRQYLKGLSEADRATVKFADKQEKAYKNASQQMGKLEADIRKLKTARDASNSTGSIKRYESAIESLEREYNRLETEVKQYGKVASNAHSKSSKAVVKDQQEVQKSQSKVSQGFQKIGASAKLWLGGAVLGALFLVKQTLQELSREQLSFDKKFNESIAIQQTNGVRISLDQQERMKRAARETARELNISTDKVAEGYFFLASAGLDVEQQIANIGIVSKFAKAGQFDLATATDLLTDAQSALGLTSLDVIENQENMIRVSDVLAKANTSANATIEQLSESLTNKAGTALKNYNKDVEEGVAVLSAYADQGIKGRLAGERFNILLKRLVESASNNKEAFEENNVAVFDSEGRFRNLSDIVSDLEDNLKGLSDQQRSARLAQLGFTAETQDAILPLIGLSQKIRDYESALKDAGGTTDDIAKNQLNNLTDRIGLMFRKLNDQFGPALLGWIEQGVDLAEKLVNRLDKVFSSDLDVLIRNLKEFGGNEDLVIRLQAQSDLKESIKLRDQLEEELEEIEVPVNIVARGGVEKTVDALTATIKSTLKGFRNAIDGEFDVSEFGLLGTVNGISDALQDLEFTTTNFDITKLDDYKTKLVLLQDSYLELTKAATSLAEKGADTSGITAQNDKLLEQINIFNEIITKSEALIAQKERVAELQSEMARGGFKQSDISVGGSGGTSGLGTQESAIKKVTEALLDYKSAIRDNKFLLNTGLISDGFFKESQEEFAISLDKKLKSILDNFLKEGNVITDDLLSAFEEAFSSYELPENQPEGFKLLSNAIERYNNEIISLQNALSVDDINKKEFLENATKASNDFQSELKSIYGQLKATGKLSPELEKLFSTAFAGINKDVKKTGNELDNIADAASGLLSVADAFGDIDDNLKNVLRGAVDLLKNMQNLKDLDGSGILGLGGTGIAGAIPLLGIAGGIGSIISGLFNDNDDDEQRKELERTIHKQIIAIEKNTQALLRDTVVGSDTRAEDVSRVEEILNSLGKQDIIFGPSGVGNIFKPGVTEDEAIKLLQELESLFPDFFDGISEDFIKRVNRDGLADTLESFQLMLRNRFEDFANNFGDYGNSVDGAIQAFRDALSFGAIDTKTALVSFIASVKELGTDIPTELLNQISDLDLSTEEGKNALDDIIKTLFDGQFLGDLSPDEYRNLLDFLQGLGDGALESEGVSRSVQVSSAITEFQANELVAIQESALFTLRNIEGYLSGSGGGGGANINSNDRPINVEMTFNNPQSEQDINNVMNEIRINLQREFLGSN